MNNTELHKLILSELTDLKNEVKEVRQTDIPALKVDVAGFRKELDSLESQQTWSTRLYTLFGSALAVVIGKYTGHS